MPKDAGTKTVTPGIIKKKGLTVIFRLGLLCLMWDRMFRTKNKDRIISFVRVSSFYLLMQILTLTKMKNLSLIIGCLVSISSFGQLPNYVPTDSLISYYPFNGNANDESGHGYNGTVSGATITADRFGVQNSAYQLSAVGSKIDLLNDGNWLKKDRTISFWFSSQSNGNLQRVLGYRPTCSGTSEEQGFEFLINSSNQIIEHWHTNYPNVIGKTFITNEWSHVAFSKKDTIGTFYVNGDSVTSIHPILGISQITTLSISSGISCIANFPNNSNKRFRGKIDEIGIWNRALSKAEISNLFNTTTNIKDKIKGQTFDIYPNPISNQFTIEGNQSLKGQSFEVYDITGKRKMIGQITGPKTKVENIELKSGVYILAIDGKLRKRLIVN